MMRKIMPATRRGDVTFHVDGRIDITAHVSRLLGLRSGDVLGLATIDSLPAEHYLYVARRGSEVVGHHACTCKPAKGNGRYLRVYSKPLSAHILTTCHAAGRITLYVGAVATVDGLGTALPLITAPYQQSVFINPQHHSHPMATTP